MMPPGQGARHQPGRRGETISFPIGLSRLALAWVVVGVFGIPIVMSALRMDPGQIVAVAMVWIFLPAAAWIVRLQRGRRPSRTNPAAAAPQPEPPAEPTQT